MDKGGKCLLIYSAFLEEHGDFQPLGADLLTNISVEGILHDARLNENSAHLHLVTEVDVIGPLQSNIQLLEGKITTEDLSIKSF